MINTIKNTHSMGRVSGGEMDLLASLGEQLKVDPEIAKLLTAEGELPADFKAALKEMSFEDAQKLVDTLTQETEAAAAKNTELSQQLQGLLPENVVRMGDAKQAGQNPQQEPELAALLKKGSSKQGIEQTPLTPKAEAAPLKNMKNAEDASRAFMPERKSIFAVQKEMAQTQQPKTAQLEQAQNTQGMLDLKNFIAKQSPSAKQRALSAQYKNEQQSMLTNKAIMEKHSSVLAPVVSAETESESMGEWSQGQEQLLPHKLESANTQGASSAAKVFDLSNLSKANDMDAVISQIQDYVVQAKAAKEPSAQMSFNHPELGDIDILVKKGAGEQVHVVIGHQSQEAAKFFKQHQGELLQTLQQSGVQVGEFKLESSGTNNQNQNQSFDQGSRQFANQQQRSGEEQQRRDDSHRREELWNLLNDQRKTA